MPNWVHNELTIHASSEIEKDNLKIFLKGDDSVISFEKILPMPKEEEDWYHWNISNWGTKWDACYAEIIDESDLSVTYQYSTAWSLPAGVLSKLSSLYNFDISYEEEQGWGGVIESRNGVMTVKEEWDIPESHADIKKRGRDCYCEESNEAFYKDCFYEKAKNDPNSTSRMLEFIKVLSASWEGDYDSLLLASKKI